MKRNIPASKRVQDGKALALEDLNWLGYKDLKRFDVAGVHDLLLPYVRAFTLKDLAETLGCSSGTMRKLITNYGMDIEYEQAVHHRRSEHAKSLHKKDGEPDVPKKSEQKIKAETHKPRRKTEARPRVTDLIQMPTRKTSAPAPVEIDDKPMVERKPNTAYLNMTVDCEPQGASVRLYGLANMLSQFPHNARVQVFVRVVEVHD